MSAGRVATTSVSDGPVYRVTITRTTCPHTYTSETGWNTPEDAHAHGETLLAHTVCGACRDRRKRRAHKRKVR